MDHRFFYCGLLVLILLIFVAPRNTASFEIQAIGSGGLNTQDARLPPGNSMSSGLSQAFRRKWGVTSY